MSLSDTLSELIAACFTGIWIETHEQEDALIEIARLCHQQEWTLATWDLDRGLKMRATDIESPQLQDPLSAIRSLGSNSNGDQTMVLVMSNLHRFLQSVELVQALQHQVIAGKAISDIHHRSRTLAFRCRQKLEKLFTIVEHALPSRGQFEEIARGIATEESELPDETEYNRVS